MVAPWQHELHALKRQVWNCCDWEIYQTVLCSWALFRFIIDSQFHTDVYTKCWLWMFAEHEWFPLSCCSLVFCHTIYICLTRASASVCFQKVLTGLCLIPSLNWFQYIINCCDRRVSVWLQVENSCQSKSHQHIFVVKESIIKESHLNRADWTLVIFCSTLLLNGFQLKTFDIGWLLLQPCASWQQWSARVDLQSCQSAQTYHSTPFYIDFGKPDHC